VRPHASPVEILTGPPLPVVRGASGCRRRPRPPAAQANGTPAFGQRSRSSVHFSARYSFRPISTRPPQTFLMTSPSICVDALVDWLARTTLMLLLIITIMIRTW